MKMRRGLSTVIGAVFFMVAATATIAFISYSMNSIENFAQSIIVNDAQSIDRLKEDIEITTVTLTDTNKFNMTIFNKGPIPTKLVRLWVTDQSSNPITHQKEDLNVLINPGEQKQNIATNLGITANPTDSYTLKAVTERGNTASFVLSADTSTIIALIVPAQVIPNEKIYVTAVIKNNSTTPSTIANLTGIMKNNATLTPTAIPTPAYKLGFDKDEMAIFSWTFNAPSSDGVIKFNASYVGAPSGAYVEKIVDVSSVVGSQSATSSEWSDKAKRVGILISGLPTPMDGDPGITWGKGKFGVGIINPLDRPVEVYAMGLSSPVAEIFKQSAYNDIEPTDGWRSVSNVVGKFSLFLWESSQDNTGFGEARIVPAWGITQFRAEIANDEGDELLESPLFVEALTSEGKLLALYTVSSDNQLPTINIMYTADISDPLNDWTFKHDNIPSGQRTQYNVTIENSAQSTNLDSEVVLSILVPKDFTNPQAVDGQTSSTGPDWEDVSILANPDGSSFIKVNTTGNTFPSGDYSTFSFNATAPVVSEISLYVFSTTAYYPGSTKISGIASAISEAGVAVKPLSLIIPPPPPPTTIYGAFTFDADNDADEAAWTFVSDNGPNGLLPSNSTRSWSHDVIDSPSKDIGPQSGQGGWPNGYVYTEAGFFNATLGVCDCAEFSDTFHMTFDTILDASVESWVIEFYTNQRGNDNNVVAQVEIKEGVGSWTNVGSSFGGSGDPDKVASKGNDIWRLRTVDLSDGGLNTDSSTQVRILLTFPSSGNNVQHNDYGIDTITISGTVIP